MPGDVIRCAAFSRLHEIDPIGSAGSYDGYVLIEHPLPWPKDASETPAVTALAPALEAAAAKGRKYRVQLLLDPERPAVAGAQSSRRVIHYWRADGAFTRFERRAHDVDAEDVVPLCLALLTGQRLEADGHGRGERDVLVCTHGRRDTCCGTMGTELVNSVPDLGPSVRLWRTSHTGGHRFAPTAITFPDGCYWAYLDDGLLPQLLDRTAPVDVAARHLRGSSGLGSPAAQTADREAFRRHGWDWLDARRTASDQSTTDGVCRVTIDYELPSGEQGRYVADVAVTRTLPILDCGQPPEAAKKSADELAVVRFEAA